MRESRGVTQPFMLSFTFSSTSLHFFSNVFENYDLAESGIDTHKVIEVAFYSNNCTDVTRPIYIFDVFQFSIELYSYHTHYLLWHFEQG